LAAGGGGVGRSEGERRARGYCNTSACVKGIAEGSISFTEDEDFGYLVAEAVPGIDEIELLQPRRLYERQGRAEEYIQIVDRLKTERVARLQEFPELSEDIVKAVG